MAGNASKAISLGDMKSSLQVSMETKITKTKGFMGKTESKTKH